MAPRGSPPRRQEELSLGLLLYSYLGELGECLAAGGKVAR